VVALVVMMGLPGSRTKKVAEVRTLMEQYRISGVPVVKADQLVGIVTNRYLRFETDKVMWWPQSRRNRSPLNSSSALLRTSVSSCSPFFALIVRR
jgi:CBS-domain-containing membrane protein